MQRDGFIAQKGSTSHVSANGIETSQINQLDNSSRHNLLDSGSLQNNSTSSPGKSALESSPGGVRASGNQPPLQGGLQPNGSFS